MVAKGCWQSQGDWSYRYTGIQCWNETLLVLFFQIGWMVAIKGITIVFLVQHHVTSCKTQFQHFIPALLIFFVLTRFHWMVVLSLLGVTPLTRILQIVTSNSIFMCNAARNQFFFCYVFGLLHQSITLSCQKKCGKSVSTTDFIHSGRSDISRFFLMNHKSSDQCVRLSCCAKASGINSFAQWLSSEVFPFLPFRSTASHHLWQ